MQRFLELFTMPSCRLFYLFFASPSLLLSLPLQHQLIHGSATIEESLDRLTITASDKTILHWQDFSVGENETARFILPNSQSSILNRVIDAYPSRLLGKLEANGRVLLINPNGVLVGLNAQINTASFIASSLDILDSAFLDGNELAFTGRSAESIINLGKIDSSEGEVFLIGRHVENQGMIQAEGEVGIIAASAVILKPKDLPGISIRVNQEIDPNENFFAYAFHHNEASEDRPSFAVLSGEIHASGERVVILGDDVLLQDHAKIDVSADFGGGTVLIGGDFQGKNPNISNALVVKTWPEATIDASARMDGDGGRVVLWADEANYFYGKISSEGGAEGGNGGFVEISSPGGFDFGGLVSTLAPNGQTGMLILDPVNVTISGGATDPTVALGNPTIFNMPPATVIINGAGLAAALALSNVTIDTTNPNIIPPIPGSFGDISFITVPFAWAAAPVGGSTLTLIANRNITNTAAAPINNSTTNGNIVMTAGATNAAGLITLSGAVNYSNAASIGFLTLSAPGNITTALTGDITHAGTSGNITITTTGAGNIAIGGNIDITNAAATNNITLNAAGTGNVTTTEPINHAGTSGNIAMTSAAGSVTISDTVIMSNAATNGAFTLNAPLGNITTNAAGDFTHAGPSGNTTITAGGSIALSGDITYSNAAATASLSFTSGNGMTIAGLITTSTTGTLLFTDLSAALMTFRANVQNANSGPVIVNRSTAVGGPAGAILIGNFANASVGSQNGATTINAPNAAVTLQAASSAQVGFFSGAAVVASGPINVTCNTLTINSSGSATAAQIGHGRCSSLIVANSSTTAAATITVIATNNITLDAAASNKCLPTIGHGARFYDGTAAGSNLAGNISVVSLNGSITLTQLSGINSNTRIGHGYFGNAVGGLIFPTIAGNITVSAPRGAVSLLSNGVNISNCVFIGHGSSEPSFGASLINGDILVECLGNLILDSINAGGTPPTASIGSLYGPGAPNVNQNIRVVAGGSILMQSVRFTQIGCSFQTVGGSIYTGDIEVVAGGNITMNTTDGTILIGVNLNGGIPGQSLSNVSVAAGGNIAINVLGPAAGGFGFIQGGGNVAVSAGGNITLTAGILPSTGGNIRIGTDHLNGGTADVRIFAGGDILANNSVSGTTNLGFAELNSPPYNVQIRASGDIQMSNGIGGAQSTTTGSIFIEADSLFQIGEFWTYTGTNITSICELPLGLPISNFPVILPATSFTNSTFPNILTPLAPDGLGAFRVLTVPNAVNMRNNIILQSTTGDITVNSACSRVDGTAQALTVGVAAGANIPGVNNVNIITTNGNLTIAGSICENAFHDVTINSVLNPWTSDTAIPTGLKGNILIRACDSISVLDDVVSSGPIGALGSITMIADNNLDGTGNLEIGDDMGISPTISTIDGSITLSAGLKDLSTCSVPAICTRTNGSTANINHRTDSLVTCLGTGTIVETASGSINMTTADIITQSGSIHLLAGVNINIGSTIQNLVASGEIILVANRDINLTNAAALIDSPNAVTLVVDNAFPNPFLAGLGKITTAANSHINGVPLQIFTSQQAYNSIGGFLTSGNLTFSDGKLFENTFLEQWCTYFGCPFQRAGLGIPYTIFYKNCLQQAMNQAQIITLQFLVDLHPYNEYPGWIEEFFVSRDGVSWTPTDRYVMGFKDPYMLRRRMLHGFNLPKYWTNVMSEGRFPDIQ